MIVWQPPSTSSSSSLPNLYRMNSSTSSPEKGDDHQLDKLLFLPSPNFDETRIAQQVNDDHESSRVEGLAPSIAFPQDQRPEKGSPLSTNKSSATVPVPASPLPTERSIITAAAATTTPTANTVGIVSESSQFFPFLSTYSEAKSVLSATSNAFAKACPLPQTEQQTSLQQDDGTIRVQSGSGYRLMKPFPWRLHEILENVRMKRLDWIVSWRPEGRSFQVHCQKSFTDIIIPMYFRHSRYKSFQRQLYLYGFRTLDVASIERGAYYHPHFQRDNRSLCRHIVRVKPKPPYSGRGKRSGNGTQSSKKRNSSNSCGGGETAKQANKSTAQTSVAHDGASVTFPPPSTAAAAADTIQVSLDLEYSSGRTIRQSYGHATNHQYNQQHIGQIQQPQVDDSHLTQPSMLSQVINFDQRSQMRQQQRSGRTFSNHLLGFSEDIISLFGGDGNEETLEENTMK